MIVVGHDLNTSTPIVTSDQHHALFQGAPRSGKTSGFLIPTVLTHRGPIVVASSKPDIFQATAAHRRSDGPVWLFTLVPTRIDPRSGIRAGGWSPLPGCADWDTARARALSMTTAESRTGNDNDQFFRSQAERLLAALLHAAAVAKYGMEDVARWALVGDLEEPARILLDRPQSAWAAGIMRGFDNADPRLRDSIIVTAADTIRVYDGEFARRQAEQPLLPIGDFVDNGGTIYVVAPSDVQQQFASLVVGLLDDIRRTTYAKHRPGKRPTLFVLDEADKIAPWPKLPSVLGEGGSQGLQVCMCIQDLSQARARWGAATDGFPTLFQHKVLLPGIADSKTLEALAAVLGTEPVPGSSSTSVRPKWPPHRLAAPPPGQAIHIDGVAARHVRVIRSHDIGGHQ
ncbi:type IV secretory system conjugative DNA transfer family protein [Ruania rhizosphaerae]|uniref:type IV secretory system conjugative DNA transfer family protein n=1 Tax=Ruania rhizosphaerae TaxID=1840413 RepID=UPI00135C2ED2|nr:type IV secretory system conjugative DNA transfer family protein [Ruania rhizosphaerae]